MSRSSLLVGGALPYLLLATPASSQQPTPSPSTDIVVTATRSARALADETVSIFGSSIGSHFKTSEAHL